MILDSDDSKAVTNCLGRKMAVAFLMVVGTLLYAPHGTAQDKGPCGNNTLNGEYAAYISGTRTIGAVTENFVGISLRRYDGNGTFTEVFASFHGAITGDQAATAAPGTTSGTYQVNDNCTGTSTLNSPVPGVIPDIVSDFVIMDQAKEIREIVTLPKTNVVSAVFKRR